MQTFNYVKAASIDKALGAANGAKFIAGGTTLVDLMKLSVETPSGLVDINILPLDKIEPLPNGGLRIGAMVRNSDLAWNAEVQKNYAVLSQAILSGASPQLRNMATTGGNLLQRTRCVYFREPSAGTPGGYGCNKRTPGTGCAALEGFHRTHAILGTSDQCIATHPSDMCVAMAALEATILVEGPKGKRTIPFADFHKLPGDTPHIENALEPGELITYVDLPKPIGRREERLSEAARPRQLRVCAGFGCRGGEGRRRAHPLRSRGHGRRRNEALALARSRSRTDGQGCRCSAFPHRGRGGAERRQTPHR